MGSNIIGTGLWGNTLFGGGTGATPPEPGAGIQIDTGILNIAIRIAGISMSPKRGIAPEILDEAFDAYNELIDAWKTEELLVWQYYRTVQALKAQQMDYQVGSGAPDWDIPRPPRIEFATILVFGEGTPNPIRRPLEILHVQDRASITLDKSYSQIPLRLYYDMAFPLATATLWPIPLSDINQIEMWLWKQLEPALTPQDPVSLPPGYLKAIRYNLAFDLAARPWTKTMGMTPEAQEIARTSKAWLKSLNREAHQTQMRTESGCGEYSGGRGRFDIFTGHFTLG